MSQQEQREYWSYIYTNTGGGGGIREVETAEEQDTGEQNQEIRHQWTRTRLKTQEAATA